jgi:acetylglutamate kinase
MVQVIKVGGNELDDPAFVQGLVEAVRDLSEPALLVHGGGKEIRTLQERLGLEPQYVDGLRVTDVESLAVVEMVLAGRVNKRLVAALTAAGVDAFGMSGVDRGAVKAEKLEHPAGDLGWVGRVARELAAEVLVFVSNVPGVLVDGRLVECIIPPQADALIADGTIAGGMIPKVRSALDAVAGGVAAVRITNLDGLAGGMGTVVKRD